MAKTDAAGSGWRARWAGWRNGGPRRAYEAAVEAWRLRDDELRRLRAWASAFPGFVGTTADLLVDLGRDEVVVSVQPTADLVDVEGHRAGALPAPELTVDPFPVGAFASTLPAGIRVMDAGMAIVTGRRVVFLGRRGTREWWYDQLTGLAHHPAAPFTLMHTRDQQAMSGLLVPPASASLFRTDLTLAYADAVGQRAAVLARLDALIAAHQAVRPPAPAAVTVARAPRGVAVSAGKLVAAGAVAIAMLVAASSTHRADSSPWPSPSQFATAAGTRAVGTPAIGSTAAATFPVLGTATSAAGQYRGAATAPPLALWAAPPPMSAPPTGPTGRPAPTPQPAAGQPATAGPDLCGAPANPYGYNYCGGSLVHKPASDVCRYFACAADFSLGHGYMIQCADGLVGMAGGRSGTCKDHGGKRRPVYE